MGSIDPANAMFTDVNKNASLIITDFLAMVCKNEQPCTAFYVEVGRSWKMSLILICR